MSVEAIQLSGDSTIISDESLAQLRGTLRGPVITAEDRGYDEARRIWNSYHDRHPAVIAKCSGTADVVDVVNFAREHSLLTAIRGGGHGVPGYASCHGGLVIDLTPMRAVWVDADNQVARVQGGAALGDLDRETQRVGLAVPAGVVSSTGVAGLTLGGGIGWLHRKHGLSCDNLRSVEIVTADGQVRRASSTQHEDLFWAVRGGGGNFGVVTEFEFDAHPVGPIVQLTSVAYPFDDLLGILRKWRDWTATIPDEVTTRVIAFAPPAHPLLPPELHNRDTVFVAGMYAGPIEEGAAIMEPIRQMGANGIDFSGPIQFRVLQGMFDLVGYGEASAYWKSTYLDYLGDDVLEIAARRANNRSSLLSVMQLLAMGGAVGRPKATDTAFGDRSAPYLLSVEATWSDPAEADDCITWARDFVAEADSLGYAKGTYLNYSGEPDAAGRSAQYGQNLDRLSRVKGKYDPDNLFRLNNNIPVRAPDAEAIA